MTSLDSWLEDLLASSLGLLGNYVFAPSMTPKLCETVVIGRNPSPSIDFLG